MMAKIMRAEGPILYVVRVDCIVKIPLFFQAAVRKASAILASQRPRKIAKKHK